MGVEIARRAGFDPHGMVRLFEAFEAANLGTSDGGFFATHPSFPERIANVTAAAERP